MLRIVSTLLLALLVGSSLEAQDAPQPTPSDTPPTAESTLVDAPGEDSRTGSDTTSAQPPQPPVAQPSAPVPDEKQTGSKADGPVKTNPCRSQDQPPERWLDRVQLGVYNTVCGSAHWFDSFFGSQPDSKADTTTHGRLSLNFRYDSIRGLEPKLRLKARYSLPRFESRVQAIVGRQSEEELLRDEATEFSNVTPSLRDDDDDWLVGLGYSPFRGSKRQLDLTGGLKVRFPLDPFVAARYRRHFVLGSSTLIRARQTLFWRNVQGAGVASRLDIDRIWGENHLMRWSTGATHAEETQGLDWHTSLTFYRNLEGGQAVAYQASWLGETDAPVTIEEFGLQAIYRRQSLRDWFFLQVSPGVVWRRESPLESRKAVPVLGFGIEMQFGKRPTGR